LTAVPGSPFAVGSNPQSLVVDPAGRYVFASNVAANQVATYSITPASGALTLVSSTAAGLLPTAMAIDPSGQFLYAANFNSNTVSAYTVSATGVLVRVPGSPFLTFLQPHGIAID
jgi:6-phosphogluconolactonase (cycloisomerase 2 family)